MMKQNNIEQVIIHNKQYKSLIIRVSEVFDFLNETNSYKTLFFVNQDQIEIINKLLNINKNISVVYQSYITNSEYQFACFYHKNYKKILSNHVSLIKVEYRNKYIQLAHKDILGALMNLRIDRKYLGDILKYNDTFYFEIANHLVNYVITNIEFINKIKVNLIIFNEQIIKTQDYITTKAIVNSLRLDNIISSILNLSREKTKEYILMNNVKVNQIFENNISYTCHNNDVLSLKGYGRYKLDCDVNRVNKKNKYIIIFHKYI